jgi:hypothetical protein
MRLFLFEWVSSGALAGRSLPECLAREGRAMRDTVAVDLLRTKDVRVVTTCDPRIPPPEGADAIVVNSPEDEAMRFEQLCRNCDATLVIAPELDGELSRRVRVAAALSPQLLNCSVSTIDLCSDKLQLAEQLLQAGIATLPTRRVADVAATDGWDDLPYPVVVKPRGGAGSQSIFLCSGPNELSQRLDEFDAERFESEAVVQPYIRGRALSLGAIFDRDARRGCQLFPLAAQRLTDDGRFQYLGGALPVEDAPVADFQDLVTRAGQIVPGLHGYVGFDLIWPDEPPRQPLLVEINPRLTTSYVGYRALAETNLAQFLLGSPVSEIVWKRTCVRFGVAGDVESIDRPDSCGDKSSQSKR